MNDHTNSEAMLSRNRQYIPGGMSSTNRLADPMIAFVRGDGARLWDADGKEYIDYHGAFAPQFLGYAHPKITEAVCDVIRSGADLFGSGPTELEGRLAEMVCANIPWIEKFVVFCSGSEATQQAIRLARGATGRDHIIVMQGGYNGWHNDVACNLMTPLEVLGPRRSPGEYPFLPISAGIPSAHQALIHPVNFNDHDSVRYVCERYPVAAILTEPILQNIGIVPPQAGYLEGLRAIADEFGALLMFDEVKTGFRHSFGGYAEIAGVTPDLAIYGKAIASGYPLGAIGGKAKWLDYFFHAEPAKRVLLAGTYNGHPVAMTAALTTLEILLADGGALYERVDALGARVQAGLEQCLAEAGVESVIARQGSAFVIYFMDHQPLDWHDLASNHDFKFDSAWRRGMIESGIYVFPIPAKQCSISAVHTAADIDQTIESARRVLTSMRKSVAA